MLFNMPQKNVIPPNLQINETNIEFVDNFIFLGLSTSAVLRLECSLDCLSAPTLWRYDVAV